MNEYLAKRRWIAEELRLKGIDERTAERLRGELLGIDKVIEGVADELQRLILMCKYVEGLTVEQTAERLHYSPRQVRRLLRRAEECVENLRKSG